VSTADQAHHERVWKALADPTRRAILDLLRERPRTTGELTGAFPEVTRFAVMKHLRVLQQAGLVAVRPRGRERWNYLNGVPLRQAYERWMRPYADRSASSTLRLKEAAEGHRREGDMPTTGQIELATLDIVDEVTVAAPREKVFDALCRAGDWWPHKFVEGGRVRFEPTVGGRFWEEWSGEGGALYATVTSIRRPAKLSYAGPMGMPGPVTSVIAYELEERDGGTLVRQTHRAFGDIDEETRQEYTAGWRQVLDALQRHLGLPTG
jgi:uncharacterized protein YndB with AHSA1/START domain/DNA-binding transcriptional ArsR family regulator